MRIVLSDRLSDAVTVKLRPPAMSSVSLAVLRVMLGGVRSRWIPPGFRVVSQAQTVAAQTTVPHSARTPRPARIVAPSSVPGARGHQVVDDVRRDQNQQVAPLLRLGREAEELAQNRQIYKKRDSRLGYRDRGHGQAPNQDRKSTRLNSSHDQISYAVFCLKKKKKANCCQSIGACFSSELPRCLCLWLGSLRLLLPRRSVGMP